MRILIWLIGLFINITAFAGDTLLLRPANLEMNRLNQGEHRYLVYFTTEKDNLNAKHKRFFFWTHSIDFTTIDNQRVLKITQRWEDDTSVIHRATSFFTADGFLPLTQDTWGKRLGSVKVDFRKGIVSTEDTIPKLQKDRITEAVTQTRDFPTFFSWHTDLEFWQVLPYKTGRVFKIPFYDVGVRPDYHHYFVKGTESLQMLNGDKVDCWVLFTDYGNNSNATFWISKNKREVLRMEEFFGGQYRYKIKIPSGYKDL
jgi:hypothetical protein